MCTGEFPKIILITASWFCRSVTCTYCNVLQVVPFLSYTYFIRYNSMHESISATTFGMHICVILIVISFCFLPTIKDFHNCCWDHLMFFDLEFNHKSTRNLVMIVKSVLYIYKLVRSCYELLPIYLVWMKAWEALGWTISPFAAFTSPWIELCPSFIEWDN